MFEGACVSMGIHGEELDMTRDNKSFMVPGNARSGKNDARFEQDSGARSRMGISWR
jgi:hypothetical protein